MLFLLPNTPSHVHILNPLPNPSPCLKLGSVNPYTWLFSLLQHKFAAPPLPPADRITNGMSLIAAGGRLSPFPSTGGSESLCCENK